MNPLHVLEEDLLAAAVIKFRGATIVVASDSLSGPVIGRPCVSVADRDTINSRP